MKKHLDLFLTAMVPLTAYQVFQYWLDRRGYQDLYNVATSQEMRPFVYRILMPILGRAVDRMTGLGVVPSLAVIVIVFSIATFTSLKFLYSAFLNDGRGSIIAFIGCEALFIVMIQESKVYDIATPSFFAFSLWALARKRYWLFYLLFPLATLNRETTLLLSAFYVVYFFNGPISRRHWFYGCVYQGVAYILIRLATMAAFAHLPGAPFILSWRHVLTVYAANYPLTLAFALCLGWIGYLTLRGWKQKPLFLRTALSIIFPIQFILHIFMGWPYEIRVFAESLPLITVLAAYPISSMSRLPAPYVSILSTTPDRRMSN